MIRFFTALRNRKTSKYVLLTAGIIFTITAILFINKDSIIRHYVYKKIESIRSQHQLNIGFSDLKTAGLNKLVINDLYIVPQNQDTLLKAGDIKIQVSLLKLFRTNIDIRKIDIEHIHINFTKTDSISNFDFIYAKRNNTNTQTKNSNFNYSKKLKQLFSFVFDLLPPNAQMEDVHIAYHNKNNHVTLSIPSFKIKDYHFNTEIKSNEIHNGKLLQGIWICNGHVKDDTHEIKAQLFSKEHNKIPIPFLEYRYNTRIEFDTLSFKFSQHNQKDIISLQGKAFVSGLTIFHNRISPENVFLDKGIFDYDINIGKNYIELNKETQIHFNHLVFNPYLKIEKNDNWHIIASVDKKDFPSDQLFTSLPKGLFHNLEGLKTSGTLSYHFFLDLDFGQLDSLKFESSLDSRNFKIIHFGKTDLRKIDKPFLYTAYENDIPVRTFEVGPGNINFRPLSQISPLLQNAVMQSEDGSFYEHKGFRIETIRESLIHDIRVGRFARGGSTISMQLVKNIFLNRNKTIARKLEEALIVWLIENNKLTSKKRIYEVYLNIAEWGPLVYGANEASHYYFDKEASELNVQEAIFLASLVPHPKSALYQFTDSLQLRPSLNGYFESIARRLESRGLISKDEAQNIKAEITIAGKAKERLLEMYHKSDSLETNPNTSILPNKHNLSRTSTSTIIHQQP